MSLIAPALVFNTYSSSLPNRCFPYSRGEQRFYLH